MEDGGVWECGEVAWDLVRTGVGMIPRWYAFVSFREDDKFHSSVDLQDRIEELVYRNCYMSRPVNIFTPYWSHYLINSKRAGLSSSGTQNAEMPDIIPKFEQAPS